MIRALIVDDERPARRGLRLRLERAPDFEVVGEAASGRAAIASLLKHEPDVVFLDIRLPDMNGFDVLLGLPAAKRPRVIFVTAYDQHALQAFEVHALDYLLKPIGSERFEAALERVRASHSQRLASKLLEELAARLHGVVAASVPSIPEEGTIDRLSVREGSRLRIVPVDTIQWIESEGNYVLLHVTGRSLLHREPLSQLERKLPPRAFARIHRGAIVRIAEVSEVRYSPHGDGEVALRDGTLLRMSRRYRDALI